MNLINEKTIYQFNEQAVRVGEPKAFRVGFSSDRDNSLLIGTVQKVSSNRIVIETEQGVQETVFASCVGNSYTKELKNLYCYDCEKTYSVPSSARCQTCNSIDVEIA